MAAVGRSIQKPVEGAQYRGLHLGVPWRVRTGLTAAALAGLLVFGTVGPAVLAADTLQQAQTQEQTVAAQLSAAQATYNQAMNAWSAAIERNDQAVIAEKQAATHLSALTGQLATAKTVLAQDQAAVAQQEVVVGQDQQKADQGLLTIQQNGTVSFLSVLLGANTFGDFLTRLSFLQSLWTLEMSWLHQARAAQAQLQSLEQQQQQQVTTLGTLQTQAGQQVTQLQQDEAAASAAQQDAAAALARADAVAKSLLSEKNGLLAKIQALLAEIDSGSVPWSQVLQDINTLAAQFGISAALVEAVVLQESGGNAAAKSGAGAQGLMQLMPSTAAALGVTNPYNPVQNLTGGITYLLEQLKRFNGNMTLALAAYNAGPYAVKEYGGVPPYRETQNYVRDVMALYQEGK